MNNWDPGQGNNMADQLPPDHPARVAWDGIRRTDYFEHMAEQGARVVAIRGTLWAAFCWGWNAALGRPPFGPVGPRALLSPNLFVAIPGDPDNAKYPISVGKLAEVTGVPRADLAVWIAYHATPLSVDEARADMGVLAAVRVKGDAYDPEGPGPDFRDGKGDHGFR